MKRLQGKTNEPELFNQEKYIGNLACTDMERGKKLLKYYNPCHYLEVGCLNSVWTVLLAEHNQNVYAIDFADKIIDYLSERFPKVHYSCMDFRNGFSFNDESFDYITAGEVIEHTEDPKKFIDECLRILKPNGWLAISTPWEEGVKQGAVDKEAHIWSFTEQDFKNWGFETELLKEGTQTSIIAWKQK